MKLLIGLLLAAGSALAGVDGAIAAGSDPDPEPKQQLDGITVYGAQNLTGLRAAMVEAEDRFYARYNELNVVEDFDVSCREEAPTGTRLTKRGCLAVYEARALRDEGFEGFKIRQFLHEPNSIRLIPASPPPPAAMAIEARRPEFQRNMRELVSRNKELAQLLMNLAALGEQFEAARRATFKLEDSGDSSRDAATDDLKDKHKNIPAAPVDQSGQ